MGVVSHLAGQIKELEVNLTPCLLCIYHPLAESCSLCLPNFLDLSFPLYSLL